MAMLIPDAYRRCATFLFVKDSGSTGESLTPRATAFFMTAPVSPVARQCYVVTARHVVSAARANNAGLWVRLNDLAGSFKDLHLADDAWVEHDVSDVAAARLAAPGDWDIAPIPVEQLLTGPLSQRMGLGVGDEVFFSGL